jgi:hypothetical protein
MEQHENSVIIVKAARWNGNHWMEISVVGDCLEIYTSNEGETDADGFDMPYVEPIKEWGSALSYRIGMIISQFLYDTKNGK